MIAYAEDEETILSSCPLKWGNGICHTLCISNEKDKLKLLFDDQEYRFEAMELKDLFGFGLGKDCVNSTLAVKATL